MSATQLGERIARHGFATRPARTVPEAAALVGGIQAQDGAAARLGVRSRSSALTEADVTDAVNVERSVVRTWLMRSTVHLVPAEDARWMGALFGPLIARKFSGVRWLQLGLTPGVIDRAADLAPPVLADGPLTRHELRDRLTELGLPVGADTETATHLSLALSAAGLLCRAGDRGRDATFDLVDAWLPNGPDGPRGDDALAELARRYFRAFSPARPADFATWSGLGAGRAIALIRDELTPALVDGQPGYRLGDVPAERGLRLLPAFDNYLIGYRDRTMMIAPERRGEVYVGGVIRPTVLLDGHVAGRWWLDRSARSSRLVVAAFEPLPRSARTAIEAEAADIARFLGRPVTLGYA